LSAADLHERMVMNSSIDLHQDVKMFTSEGERKGGFRLEKTFDFSSFNQGSSRKRMSRRHYNETFNNTKFATRIIPFHNTNILQVDEKGNTTLHTDQPNNLLLTSNPDVQTGHITHRSEIIGKARDNQK